MKPLFVDTHVHFQPGFDPRVFLDAAAAHFAAHARAAGTPPGFRVLCAVDSPGQDTPAVFRAAGSLGVWRMEQGEAGAVTARSDAGELWILPGRQWVSAENLEVLALDCEPPPPEPGTPLRDLVARVRDAGGIPVLPWGVGKWTGARAALIHECVCGDRGLWFADNGNRLRGTPLPAALRYLEAHGMPALAGSDPLPMARHNTRAGSYCVRWMVEEDGASGPRQLLRTCLEERRPGEWTGALTGPLDFMRDQARMQIRKRRRGREG